MKFEWDPQKEKSNFEKHGIRFDEARLIFDGPVLTAPDNRFDYGEKRQISVGAIKGLVIVAVVHTERDGSTRIISARLANRRERTLYHDYISGKT